MRIDTWHFQRLSDAAVTMLRLAVIATSLPAGLNAGSLAVECIDVTDIGSVKALDAKLRW
jgi:hypothetical protein